MIGEVVNESCCNAIPTACYSAYYSHKEMNKSSRRVQQVVCFDDLNPGSPSYTYLIRQLYYKEYTCVIIVDIRRCHATLHERLLRK